MTPIETLKKEILEKVAQYARSMKSGEDIFTPGQNNVPYSGRVYDENEMVNLVDSSLEFYLTAGRYDKDFCTKLSLFLSALTKKRIRVLTANSGSSANLLAISALTSYKLGDLALKEGDEIITVAAGFPTTVAPIFQNRLVPVFVDVALSSYNINPSLIENALTSRTKAIFVAHTLGIPFDLNRVLSIAEKYKLWVIEDNCDALGAEYTLSREYSLIKDRKVSGTRYTGTCAHIATSSFYPAHQITMGEGGAVYTYDNDLYNVLISLRDWGRDCWCLPGKDNTCGKRFSWKFGNLPEGYDHKYIYSHLGYNLKITDMQAAIGLAQLDKLPLFKDRRFENWTFLQEETKDLGEFFILPEYPEEAKPSPFGFALTVRKEAGFTRSDITRFLESQKIQTRTVFSGNIVRQPAVVNGGLKYRVSGILKNTDTVMQDTFWIGVYPGLRKEMLVFMVEKIREFVSQKKPSVVIHK